MKTISLAVATALYLGAAAVSAATLSITPANSTALPGAGNPTNPTTIIVQYDNTGYGVGAGDSIDGDVIYDATKVSVTVTGSCNGATPGDVIIAAADGLGATIASGPVCTMTFTTLAGAALGNVIALDLQNVIIGTNGAADPVQPVVTDGTITISAAPPANAPVLTFAPAGGTIVSGGNFTITPSGGQAGGSAAYTCTPAGGVVLSNGAGTINTGGAAVAVGATCPAGPDGSVACTHTGFAGSTASPVNYTIDCPLAPTPVLASSPANGTTLTCNGAPGAAVTTQATIQNTGNANMTGVTCNVIGAGFALTTAPTPIIAGGGSSNAVVTCTVPAAGAPTATGTLSCTTTAPAGGALSFPLSSSGQTTPTFVEPDIIPASSLWSKIGLIGLLAALGMLMVGFRRQQ